MTEPMPPIASALDRLHHPGRPATPPCAHCAVQRHTDADTIADLRRQVEDAEAAAAELRQRIDGQAELVERPSFQVTALQHHERAIYETQQRYKRERDNALAQLNRPTPAMHSQPCIAGCTPECAS